MSQLAFLRIFGLFAGPPLAALLLSFAARSRAARLLLRAGVVACGLSFLLHLGVQGVCDVSFKEGVRSCDPPSIEGAASIAYLTGGLGIVLLYSIVGPLILLVSAGLEWRARRRGTP